MLNEIALLVNTQADDQASDEPIAPPKRRPRWQMPYGAPRRPSEFQKPKDHPRPAWMDDPSQLPRKRPGAK